MISRFLTGACALVLLGACQPAPPDDTRFGVGFDQTFDAQQANRDAALSGGGIPPAPGVSATPLPEPGSAEETAAQTADILARTSEGNTAAQAAALNSGVPPVEASPGNPPPAVIDSTTGISRENNFDAVASQRSIDADAARVAANRAQYQVIPPTALPERTDAGPNIVAYALQTSHPVGTKLYSRFGFNAAGKYNRNCGQYRHQDQAQIAFLAAGGPEKDPKGMDPDGDGYACTWDPAIYRNVNG